MSEKQAGAGALPPTPKIPDGHRLYYLRPEQLERLNAAARPMPVMAMSDPAGGPPIPMFGTPYSRSMEVWRELGHEMGFDPETVQPISSREADQPYFTAKPTREASPPGASGHKLNLGAAAEDLPPEFQRILEALPPLPPSEELTRERLEALWDLLHLWLIEYGCGVLKHVPIENAERTMRLVRLIRLSRATLRIEHDERVETVLGLSEFLSETATRLSRGAKAAAEGSAPQSGVSVHEKAGHVFHQDCPVCRAELGLGTVELPNKPVEWADPEERVERAEGGT